MYIFSTANDVRCRTAGSADLLLDTGNTYYFVTGEALIVADYDHFQAGTRLVPNARGSARLGNTTGKARDLCVWSCFLSGVAAGALSITTQMRY